jgi:SAM-dependent methyltransferase
MSFGAIADDYDRLRPGPAPEALDWLLPVRRQLVVDLAAGTGLMSRELARVAGQVVAVEPDDRMRSVLQARSPGVRAMAGRGEAIPLPDASADAVIVSSAWHWMNPALAVPEIARVLRDEGRFGVIWTGRDRSTEWLRADEWFAEAHEIVDSEVDQAAHFDREQRVRGEHRRVRLPDPAMFRNIETQLFHFTRRMTIADLVDYLTTYSRVIIASDEARALGRARATAALTELFPGAREIDVPMRSGCWRADRVPR